MTDVTASSAPLKNDLAGTGTGKGAALVGYIQKGAGAVARTAQNKMRETATVLDYGALANAVANDAPAFTAALAAHNAVFLPDGRSKVETTISLPHGANLTGTPRQRMAAAGPDDNQIISAALQGLVIGGDTVKIAGLDLTAEVSNVDGSAGITGLDKYFLTIEDTIIGGFQTAVKMEKALYHSYKRCDFNGTMVGAAFEAAAGQYNVDWFNNVITMENCRFLGAQRHGLDFQGQGLKAVNCDFSGGASIAGTSGIKAVVRIRAGTWDADFDNPYVEALAPGASAFLCEGGLTHIRGGFMQGGSMASPCGAIVHARNGARVVIEGITGQDFWTNIVHADGPGTTVYLMPSSAAVGSLATTGPRILTTNGAKVIDLSGFNPEQFQAAGSYAPAAFTETAAILPLTGTYTYDIPSGATKYVTAVGVLNGGANSVILSGAVHWVSGGIGVMNITSSAGTWTASINNATGRLTITNTGTFGGTINFSAGNP